MAQAGMLEEGVVSLEALRTIMTAHGLLYGANRFINGFWADRVNARVFMVLGLVCFGQNSNNRGCRKCMIQQRNFCRT